jgi:hypothetical protein
VNLEFSLHSQDILDYIQKGIKEGQRIGKEYLEYLDENKNFYL